MKYTVLFTFLLAASITSAQDNNTNQILFEQGEDELLMTASVNHESLAKVLDEEMVCEGEEFKDCADRYLAKKFMLIINGDQLSYQLDSVKTEDDTYHMYYHIDFKPSELNEVWVKSYFMTGGEIPRITEVIFDINGRSQSDQMSKEKFVSQFYF